jgi:mortality factor 4-like protein 1
VPESRVLKFNEENLKRQADLQEVNASKKKTVVEKKAPEVGGEKRKRPRDSSVSGTMDTFKEFSNRLEIKIMIPDDLKVKLVDDWENITKNQKVRSESVFLALLYGKSV